MIENISPAGLVVCGSAGDRRGWNEGHVCVCVSARVDFCEECFLS